MTERSTTSRSSWTLPDHPVAVCPADGMVIDLTPDSAAGLAFDKAVVPETPRAIAAFPPGFADLPEMDKISHLQRVQDAMMAGALPDKGFIATLIAGNSGSEAYAEKVDDIAEILLIDDMEDIAVGHLSSFLAILKDETEPLADRLLALRSVYALRKNYNPLINLFDRYEQVALTCMNIIRDEPQSYMLVNSCLATLSVFVKERNVRSGLNLADLALPATRCRETENAARNLVQCCLHAYGAGQGQQAPGANIS